MKTAIKVGKGYLPPEVKAAVKRINTALATYGGGEFQVNPYDMERLYISRPHSTWSRLKEWFIAENYEGSASATVYKNKQWFYRDPWSGKDKPIPGGVDEVVSNWVCYFTA